MNNCHVGNDMCETSNPPIHTHFGLDSPIHADNMWAMHDDDAAPVPHRMLSA